MKDAILFRKVKWAEVLTIISDKIRQELPNNYKGKLDLELLNNGDIEIYFWRESEENKKSLN